MTPTRRYSVLSMGGGDAERLTNAPAVGNSRGRPTVATFNLATADLTRRTRSEF